MIFHQDSAYFCRYVSPNSMDLAQRSMSISNPNIQIRVTRDDAISMRIWSI